MAIVFSAPVIPTGEPTAWTPFTGPTFNINQTRLKGEVAQLPDGTFYINYQSFDGAFTQRAETFDPDTLTYTNLTSGIFGQPGRMSQLSDGDLLCTGNTFNAWTYNQGTESFTITDNSSSDTGGHGQATINGDAVYKFGGRNRINGFYESQVTRYSRASRLWSTSIATMPKALNQHVAVPLDDGRILVGMGVTFSNVAQFDMWFFDPGDLSFTPTTSVPPASWGREHTGVVQLDNGLVYFAGRDNGSSALRDDTFTFNPSTETWAVGAVVTPQRRDGEISLMSKLDDGRIVIHYTTTSYVSTHL